MTLSNRVCLLALLAAVMLPRSASAQIDARMLRYPAVSKTQIAFVYAGDIWLVGKEGGSAFRLTSSPGEESFPRFSPDGSKVAYSASYDGNVDVYVIPSAGGEPTRLTYHPMTDRVIGWTPDGEAHPVRLRARERPAALQPVLHRRPRGRPARRSCPCPTASSARYSPDGGQFVYMPMAQDFRNWKRYRGGWSPDLWLFDLTASSPRRTSHRIRPTMRSRCGMATRSTSSPTAARTSATTSGPYDMKAGTSQQVTQFNDFDITFPSLGPDGIVFQAGGRLYFLDVPSGKQQRGAGPGGDRRDDAATAHGEGRAADPERLGVADGEARAVRSARRRVHGAGGIRPGRERQPLVGRGGALSALVA